jgi:GNAT superfamily N-acetyltransferase
MQVRRATVDDAMAIATVHVRSWQEAYPGLVPQDYLDGLDPGAGRGRWENVLRTTAWPSTGTFVLVDDGADTAAGSASGQGTDASAVVGFAGIGPTRDDDDDPTVVGELQTLYVDPRAWGHGGGQALLGAVSEEFGRAGFRTATAWVLGTNARARRFYERHGWRPDGSTKLHDWEAFVATDVRYRVPLA